MDDHRWQQNLLVSKLRRGISILGVVSSLRPCPLFGSDRTLKIRHNLLSCLVIRIFPEMMPTPSLGGVL